MSLPHPRSSHLDGSLTTAAQNLNPRDPLGRPTRLACSSVDLLWVMSYAPGEGDQGTPISVNFACKADLSVGINIRLVVGRRAVSTQVHEIDSPGGGRWQLTGHAPSFFKQKSATHMVPLTIQAVNKENRVMDSVTFGDFVYRNLDGGEISTQPVSPQTLPTGSNPPSRPNLRTASGGGADRSSKRPSPYQSQTPPSSDSEYGSPQGSRPHTQLIAPTLRRASRQTEPEDTTQTVILDIATPLDSFCFDWEESELHAGRRLVRFRRLQDGNRLIVSAERISQIDYDPDDIVISCIYREETDSCCVTSVDIIHLLQRLVEADFEVDEKNRIRRNLEGLRPITVSKARPGFESFFQRIMDFPEPKPRKIEKDVKVFDWKLLPHALDKILSKYSLYASPATSSPKDEVPSPSFSAGALQDVSVGSSSDGAASACGDNASELPHEPHLDALYLSQASPVFQLPLFAHECSPDSSPEMQRRHSLHEEQFQSIYLDSGSMQRYFSEPNVAAYSVSPPLAPSSVAGPLPSPMYTGTELSAAVACDTATTPFVVAGRAQHEWATGSTDDVMPVYPQASVHLPAYTYESRSDTADSEPMDMYATLSYPINTYDSFEFQTLREHNHNMNAMLASQQHA